MQINGLTKRYGKTVALNNVSICLDRKIYGLMGANGAGKTTLLRCIAGLLKPDAGTVTANSAGGIGYLPQSYGAIGNFTVLEMMEFYSVHRKINADRKTLLGYLKAVHLDEQADTKVSRLSGGMLRRLGIAQTLIGEPKLLLFDEPTVGLDPEERHNFLQLLKQLGEGRTIILSTHILNDIDEVCEERIFLASGTICATGTREALCQRVEEESGAPCNSTEEAYLWLAKHI